MTPIWKVIGAGYFYDMSTGRQVPSLKIGIEGIGELVVEVTEDSFKTVQEVLVAITTPAEETKEEPVRKREPAVQNTPPKKKRLAELVTDEDDQIGDTEGLMGDYRKSPR